MNINLKIKANNRVRSRYILDALYGVIHLPEYVWEILFIPEIQRLREVRLYNINSLYFTGGANINRYEHSLGTCHLALLCVEANFTSLHYKDKMLIVLAALLHDLYNAAFGHSVEYVEKFSPATLFPFAAMGKKYPPFKYKHAEFEPIYFGMCEELLSKLITELDLSPADIDKIGDYINGKGEYGSLISGTIDLDNIDNIYRMSYHMGLTRNTHIPAQLAKSMWCQKGELYMDKSAIPLVTEWEHLRERLYKFLLLNPDEFSAKFMLTEAIELSKESRNKVYSWYNTDFQILENLSKTSPEISNIISRLMKGKLYGCFGLYRTTKIDKFKALSNIAIRKKIENDVGNLIQPTVFATIPGFSEKEKKIIKGIRGIYYNEVNSTLKITYKANKQTIDKLLENELKKHKSRINRMYSQMQTKRTTFKLENVSFGIHTISDVNKTNRQVIFRLPNNKVIRIGHPSKYLYIGVFVRNINFANFNPTINAKLNNPFVKNVKSVIKKYLKEYLEDANLEDIELYSETINA